MNFLHLPSKHLQKLCKRPPKYLPKTSSIPPENPPGPGTPKIWSRYAKHLGGYMISRILYRKKLKDFSIKLFTSSYIPTMERKKKFNLTWISAIYMLELR